MCLFAKFNENSSETFLSFCAQTDIQTAVKTVFYTPLSRQSEANIDLVTDMTDRFAPTM